jgi:hypothetical protein
MRDFERGFRIDGRLVAWGATLAKAAEKLGLPAHGPRLGYSTLNVCCGKACGFAAVGAELTAYGLSRPVTAVACDLAPPAREPAEPQVWTRPLAALLGPASEETTEEVGGRREPADVVRYYANWDRGDFSVGLSVYGGPRQVEGGVSPARLWLSWSTERAAAPYLAEWHAAGASLAVAARGAEGLRTFQLGFDQHALHGDGREPAGKAKLSREAWLALAAPDILLTPAPVAKRLSKRQFALWSNPGMKVHCLSTRWDSVIWDDGASPKIDWWHVLPAKGPGQSALHAGNWSVVDFADSTSVPDAIRALEAIPGVRVNRLDGGYDC